MTDDKKIIRVCTWIGEGERCRCPTLYSKAYCETHYDRMYITMLPEMANYIIDKTLDNDKKI